jgi:16S rRNA (cytosine967-C5)-methyltransferase
MAGDARAAARTAVAAVARGVRLDRALGRALRPAGVDRFDRRDCSFVETAVKAVVRHRRWLDYQLLGAAARPLTRLPPPVLATLRLAVAELFLMNTPAYAAVNEAVASVRAGSYGNLAGFVNGVLRKLAAGPPAAVVAADAVRLLGVTYSFPDWLVRRWLARFGPDDAEALLRTHNAPAPLTVLPAPPGDGRPGRAELIAALAHAGVGVADGPFGTLELALGDVPLTAAPGFAEGWFIIVDPASTLAPRWLAPPPGAVVLDLCAGAGGKAFQLAWAVGPAGKVYAVDLNERKLAQLTAAAQRLGLSNIEMLVADVRRAPLPEASYVLLDAPCTNLGVIRHKPDVKWRLVEADLARAAATEEELLRRVLAAVAPGAKVLYNVCSTEAEESEELVTRVMADMTGYVLEPPDAGAWGPAAAGSFIRTWPPRDGCNGGFAALIRRTA